MKLARHEKIIELIKEYDIDTQEELATSTKPGKRCQLTDTLYMDMIYNLSTK